MTRYVFDKDSLDGPEFKQAAWANYKDKSGKTFLIVRIGDPFVVRTKQPDGEYEYENCESGFLAIDNETHDIFPVIDEELARNYEEITKDA
jgi:hypothetical protein